MAVPHRLCCPFAVQMRRFLWEIIDPRHCGRCGRCLGCLGCMLFFTLLLLTELRRPAPYIEYFNLNQAKFTNNKGDFLWVRSIQDRLGSAGYCKRSANKTIFISGLNKGQLAHEFLDKCRGLTLYGAEIQPDKYAQAKDSFAGFPSVFIRNCGIGDTMAAMHYRGGGESASLFAPDKRGGAHWINAWEQSPTRVEVFPTLLLVEQLQVAQADAEGVETPQSQSLFYTVIGTEGFEPFVLVSLSFAALKEGGHLLAFLPTLVVASRSDGASTCPWCCCSKEWDCSTRSLGNVSQFSSSSSVATGPLGTPGMNATLGHRLC